MTAAVDEGQENHVCVVPPTRRDGEVTCSLLARVGIACSAAENVADLTARLTRGWVGVIVLTDFSLVDASLPSLITLLARQPPWSDIPVVMLTRDRDQSVATAHALAQFTNITVLDRPVSTRSMVSAVRAALRARQWQYRIRDQWLDQERSDQALRDADRRKDEFLATLAHELRNPLSPIRSGLEWLDRCSDDVAQAARVRQMMSRQVNQLVRLIDDLLDISRIATGKVALQRERIDLRTVVGSATEACQPLIDQGRHHLTVHLPSEPVWTLGDATRLAQVVSNLVNNAAKYTPSAGEIRVALERDEGRARLTVADNGAGIPHAMLEEVFAMFTQVNQTLDRAQGGLGIGLSLVRHLTELHGGTVSASSRGLGHGSCFTVSLPIASAATVGGSRPTRPVHATTRTFRVLIVDDNEDAADSLGMLLESHGHVTRVAYSGPEALQAADEFGPQVVLCDVGLPGMDGHEVASRLRARRDRPLLLVAVTGWGSESDRLRTTEAGFDKHLVKPVDLDAIVGIFSAIGE